MTFDEIWNDSADLDEVCARTGKKRKSAIQLASDRRREGKELKRFSTSRWGPKNPVWKGDAAGRDTKRYRAVRRYSLGKCQRCDAKATDRHHKDDDTGNNHPSNIELLCRRCHMKIDGRLEVFRARPVPIKPPSPCRICGRLSKPHRKGRCGRCSQYFDKFGVERPVDLSRAKKEQ